MYTSSLYLILALTATVQGVAIRHNQVQHEKRAQLPSQWVKRGKLDPKHVLPMQIGLKQRNLERGYDFVMEISHPNSPKYSRHWTQEEVNDMFSPEEKTVEMVKGWLNDSGIHVDRVKHSDNKGWLAFDAYVDEAERLLNTNYDLYEHSETGHVTPACESYHIPKHLVSHIDYVTPGIELVAPARRKKELRKRDLHKDILQTHPVDLPLWDYLKATESGGTQSQSLTTATDGALAHCDQASTHLCIKALYGIPDIEYPNQQPRTDNSLGIFETGDFYAQEDLDLFFSNFSTGIPAGTAPILASVDGGEAPVSVSEAGGESDLDFELAYPIIYPQTTTLYQTDDEYWARNSKGGFNTFLDSLDKTYCSYSDSGETGDDPKLDPIYPDTNSTENQYKGQTMCGQYNPTNVISVSYGGQENDIPNYYQQRQCNEFMKLALMGITILFASGDSGVAGRAGQDNDNGCLGDDANIFSPDWPANCPYVTSVGATKILPGNTVHDPEVAVNDPAGHPYAAAFSSGGGFSNIYPIAPWQKNAVETYFNNNDPGYKYYSGNSSFGQNGGIYNRAGRGYPDVSANGDNIATFNQGAYSSQGGTSASTPIFAAIINRINEARLNAGKKVVGFVSPALYQNPGMLNDITSGNNAGCGTNGFSAVPGWDPVSGLGTPNYPKMMEYFMALP